MLLTDGKVDVSKDPAKNEKSRNQVLTASLQASKKAGFEVHSIALSDATGEVLLRQLALETGGSFGGGKDHELDLHQLKKMLAALQAGSEIDISV